MIVSLSLPLSCQYLGNYARGTRASLVRIRTVNPKNVCLRGAFRTEGPQEQYDWGYGSFGLFNLNGLAPNLQSPKRLMSTSDYMVLTSSYLCRACARYYLEV